MTVWGLSHRETGELRSLTPELCFSRDRCPFFLESPQPLLLCTPNKLFISNPGSREKPSGLYLSELLVEVPHIILTSQSGPWPKLFPCLADSSSFAFTV